MSCLDPHALKIFIDGSAYNNPGGAGGCAAIVQHPDDANRPDEIAFELGYKETTNNRMELRALINALEYVNQKKLHVSRVQIVTDSKYIHDNYQRAAYWRANKWSNLSGKPVENRDFWKEYLRVRSKCRVSIAIVRRQGKTSPILKAVDRAAKLAAHQPWELDRGFRQGKIGRSKGGRGSASSLFPATGDEALIRVYRTNLVGRSGYKVMFETYLEPQGAFGDKFHAFAASPELAAELHRGHAYRVLFNDNRKYPLILQILEPDLPL